MKLSLLVDYLQQLESISIEQIVQTNTNNLDNLMRLVLGHEVMRFEGHAIQLDRANTQIRQGFGTIRDTVKSLKKAIRDQISTIEPDYLQRSLLRFMTEEFGFSSNIDALQRRLTLSDDERAHVLACITNSQDVGWPGLIVRPGNQDWITSFTTYPTYVLDYTAEQIQEGIAHLPGVTQDRLCKYTISETLGRTIMPQIPRDQIGVSVLWFFLNFRPWEIVRKWLDELWQVTRPGGRVMFTYNDCDQAHGVALYESGYMSYTPGHRIRSHAISLGFEIVEDWHPTADLAWMILKKPGSLITSRACYPLAKVIARPK